MTCNWENINLNVTFIVCWNIKKAKTICSFENLGMEGGVGRKDRIVIHITYL